MDEQKIGVAKIEMRMRVYRAHDKPVGMSESDYKRRVALQDEEVGHWEDHGVVPAAVGGVIAEGTL